METLLNSPLTIAGIATVVICYTYSYRRKMAFKKLGYTVSLFPNLFIDFDSVYRATEKAEDEKKKSELTKIKNAMFWNMMIYTVGFVVLVAGVVISITQSS